MILGDLLLKLTILRRVVLSDSRADDPYRPVRGTEGRAHGCGIHSSRQPRNDRKSFERQERDGLLDEVERSSARRSGSDDGDGIRVVSPELTS